VSDVESILDGRKVCVCAGSGGVGKTTAAAAIALGAAARGARVAVLTIDPARRLATSLGLDELGNEAHLVDPARLAGAGGPEMRGELWAVMLDAKRTFDELIERRAPDERTRDAVLSNRIYQELSSAMAGSQEYMAMEKLYELHEEGRFDLLVLDTPPTRNALDFLDAPERLTRFIDSRSLQLFLRPSRTGLRIFGRSTAVMFSVLERITGVNLLRDLSEFFASFGDMTQGIRDRAKRVRELLAGPESTFLLITSPRREAIDDAVFFHRRLSEGGMPFGGAIVNRMHGGLEDEPEVDPAALERQLAGPLGAELAAKVVRNHADYRKLAARDRRNVELLVRELGGEPLIVVPHLDEDVHDIEGLLRIDRYLFGDGTLAS
jgi:anion-transporting  ArsA/GET3 family ATPase